MTQSITLIISVMVFVFIVSTLIKILTPKIKGHIGESAVIRILSRLPSDYYKVLNDVMLYVDDRTTQIDHIVVSSYGIFVIETKNYKGLITGSEFAETWTKNMYGKKYTFHNPLKQNYGHVKTLEKSLGLTEDKFIPVVVFSTNSNLKVKTVQPVIYTSKLKLFIESFQEKKLGCTELDGIVKKIQSLNISSKEIRKIHNSNIRRNVKSNKVSIAQRVCPKCGGTLIERNGKYGKFFGCSNYPKCRFTLKK
ncbi:NERD domain-containing protein [Anaerovorax odorimutans]|uniref:NERD domain-containing protein n=1 Tax=Anaerovorax odorimutans TaxID=109327 RepID=A0ABT1RL11_9FIRM|nr:NERD domain-containing protein [Anaerovorax odorimutans]MCQ4635868.1 NERD domain-containing protein [Anaerovorax odorimutans]